MIKLKNVFIILSIVVCGNYTMLRAMNNPQKCVISELESDIFKRLAREMNFIENKNLASIVFNNGYAQVGKNMFEGLLGTNSLGIIKKCTAFIEFFNSQEGDDKERHTRILTYFIIDSYGKIVDSSEKAEAYEQINSIFDKIAIIADCDEKAFNQIIKIICDGRSLRAIPNFLEALAKPKNYIIEKPYSPPVPECIEITAQKPTIEKKWKNYALWMGGLIKREYQRVKYNVFNCKALLSKLLYNK